MWQYLPLSRAAGEIGTMIKQLNRTAKRRGFVAPETTSDDVLAVAFETDLGWMAIAHQDGVLRGIVFGHTDRSRAVKALERNLGRDRESSSVADWMPLDYQPAAIVDVVERLVRFADGEPVDFGDVVVDESHLTPFGKRIVKACRRIPTGQTRSYGELATESGSPGAARAVGQVMARNRYPLVVPCHRVLAAGGRIGGFSAPQGLNMKRRLLELEGEK
jgi:methylated-DNA-[protein]-cysteine S-methyltransferase